MTHSCNYGFSFGSHWVDTGLCVPFWDLFLRLPSEVEQGELQNSSHLGILPPTWPILSEGGYRSQTKRCHFAGVSATILQFPLARQMSASWGCWRIQWVESRTVYGENWRKCWAMLVLAP